MKAVIEDIFLKYMLNILDLNNLHSDLPFLSERMKLKKCNKLVCNFYDKKEYVVHVKALKKALNHGLILKKTTYSNSV